MPGPPPWIRPAHWRWHVVVKVEVNGHYLGLSALGPISWSAARGLADRWERSFGDGTAAVVERPRRGMRRVEVWCPVFRGRR